MHQERYEKLQSALEQILIKLKEEYKPEKVILFGSMASGEVTEWSDIDLAIIKETRKRFVDRSIEVALLCRSRIGVDYLIYTPNEFDQMVEDENPFILDEILKTGKVLYERKPATAVA